MTENKADLNSNGVSNNEQTTSLYRKTNHVSFNNTKNGLVDRFSLPAVLTRIRSINLRVKPSTGFQTKPLSL